jgi:hypothetical protein
MRPEACAARTVRSAQPSALAVFFTVLGTGAVLAQTSVPNTASLESLRHADVAVAIREGYLTPGDAPPLTYVSTAAPCSLRGGAGDGGAQVRTGDQGCWIASFPGNVADAREWGVVVSTTAPSDAALNAAAAWAGANGGTILLPGGPITVTGRPTVALSTMKLECENGPASANAAASGPIGLGRQGTTFWIESTNQPFTTGTGVRVEGCSFYWPNQNGASPPAAYPPLFTEPPGQQMANVDFIDDRVINAYDFLDQTSLSDPFGAIHLIGTQGYAIHDWFRLGNVPEFITLTNFVADSNLFQTIANPGHSGGLAAWTAANGAVFDIFGNGNGSTAASTALVQGLTMAGAGINGYRYGAHVEGGATSGFLTETRLDGMFDGVPSVLEVDPGGAVANTKITGQFWGYQLGNGNADHYTLFSVTDPATNANSNFEIDGELNQSNGSVVALTGSQITQATIRLAGGGVYGQSTTAGIYYFANVNASNLILRIENSNIQPASASSANKGILLTASLQADIIGNTFNGVFNPIDPASNTNPITIVGNTSTNTPSSTAVAGDGASNIVSAGNGWDKRNPTVDGASCSGAPSSAFAATDGIVTHC